MWACSRSCQLGFVFNPLNLARRRDDIMPFHGMRLEGWGTKDSREPLRTSQGRLAKEIKIGQSGE